jgi:uncharacterized protein (TIRG00374 family)
MAQGDTPFPPARPRPRRWRFWLGAAVSLALVGWAAWTFDWQQVWSALGRAQPGWVVAALATVLLTIAARVLRWQGLLLPQRFGVGALLTALLAGQVVNYVVLSQLGVFVRAAALGSGNRARALGTVLVEKLWDVIMLLGLVAALSLGLTLPDWLVLPARLLAVGSAVAIGLILAVLLLQDRFSQAIGRWSHVMSDVIGRWLSATLDGLEGIIRPQMFLWGLLGSLVVWGLGTATNWCLLRAFGLPSGAAPVLLLLAALQAGVAVPSLPGSVGVFEGICIAVLALFGVGREEALAMGLVLHVVVFAPPLLLGGLLMWRSSARQGLEPAGSNAAASMDRSIDSLKAPLSNQPASSPSPHPSVSVIIPVYNGAETLPECLRALQAQTFPAQLYEVVVVDDGSTDDTAEVARGWGVRVISQPNAGAAAARNRGAQEVQGGILLFTDADCAPDPDWIQHMVAPFIQTDSPQSDSPNGSAKVVVGAKGVYRTRQRSLVARFVQAEYEDRYDRMRDLDEIDFIDTYSAAYRRDVFLASGGFDTSFPSASVEDQEFSFRLAGAGHRLVFVPDAQVSHVHDRAVDKYARRKFWIGYWKVRVMREHPSKLIRDSHTPQVLKVQMGLAALGALMIVGGIWNTWLAVAGLVAWAGLIAAGLPFILKLWRRDTAVTLIAPLMLFVRAWALGLGFLAGLVAMSATATHDK